MRDPDDAVGFVANLPIRARGRKRTAGMGFTGKG